MAVSCSADRSIKLWDLQRGYASRSIPCAKMPNALCLSMDGATILTGGWEGGVGAPPGGAAMRCACPWTVPPS